MTSDPIRAASGRPARQVTAAGEALPARRAGADSDSDGGSDGGRAERVAGEGGEAAGGKGDVEGRKRSWGKAARIHRRFQVCVCARARECLCVFA